MARPLRLEYPGGVYHVTSRGNARQRIYTSAADRQAFLGILASVVNRSHWLCHAYCLMDNHYHLLIETPEANLSRGMRQLNGIYTQWFNRTHHRVGHLFQGRYKAIVVDKESHLLELCRYVVLNPVRAKMTRQAGQWPWSSYRAMVGKEAAPDYLTVDWVLGQFSENKRKAQERYHVFVTEGMRSESPWNALKGQVLLGSEQFVDRHRNRLKEAGKIKEIPRRQRYAGRPRLEEIFKGSSREQSIYQAHVDYGYTLREISDQLDLHYTTVSKIIKQVEPKIKN
jgi:REP element-mobilizing transposase RayT